MDEPGHSAPDPGPPAPPAAPTADGLAANGPAQPLPEAAPPLPPHVPRAAPARPRVWTALVAVAAAFVGAQAAAVIGVVAYAVLLIARGELGGPDGPRGIEDRLLHVLATPEGLLFTVIPAEMAFLLGALVPAFLSAEPWRERLGLVRGRLPLWGVPVLVLGHVFVLAGVQAVFELVFPEPSEHLVEFAEAVAGATGVLATILLLALSVLPGVCEELLFRGYVQLRLLRRWGAPTAIAVTSVAFGLVHVDPQHAAMTALIGVWLGVVGWRTGAVWPCILCHAFNNFVGVGAVMATAEMDGDTLSGLTAPVLAASAPFFIAAIVVLWWCGRGAGDRARAS